jgi:hypothetical protein
MLSGWVGTPVLGRRTGGGCGGGGEERIEASERAGVGVGPSRSRGFVGWRRGWVGK